MLGTAVSPSLLPCYEQQYTQSTCMRACWYVLIFFLIWCLLYTVNRLFYFQHLHWIERVTPVFREQVLLVCAVSIRLGTFGVVRKQLDTLSESEHFLIQRTVADILLNDLCTLTKEVHFSWYSISQESDSVSPLLLHWLSLLFRPFHSA